MSESITTETTIFDIKPTVIALESGTYYMCSCGLSQNQPFCNGAHEGTAYKPVVFELTEAKQVAFFMCRHTAKAPFCDATHHNL